MVVYRVRTPLKLCGIGRAAANDGKPRGGAAGVRAFGFSSRVRARGKILTLFGRARPPRAPLRLCLRRETGRQGSVQQSGEKESEEGGRS